MDSRSTVGEDPSRGRVRHLKGFRVEVNGRVYARLGANKTNITLKKCKSGMKYTCVVVVMTCPEKTQGYQRKVRRITDCFSNQWMFLASSRRSVGVGEQREKRPVEKDKGQQ